MVTLCYVEKMCLLSVVPQSKVCFVKNLVLLCMYVVSNCYRLCNLNLECYKYSNCSHHVWPGNCSIVAYNNLMNHCSNLNMYERFSHLNNTEKVLLYFWLSSMEIENYVG